MAAKYETLEALMMAYRNRQLSAPLWLDNDASYVYADDKGTAFGDDAVSVFDMDSHDLLEQALTLLGIPYEHV